MDIKAALDLLEGYPHEYGSEPYGYESSEGDVQICIRSKYLPTGRVVDTLSMDEAPYDRENLNARGEESKRQFAIYLHEYCLDNTEKNELLGHDESLEKALIKAAESLKAHLDELMSRRVEITDFEIPF